jgi:hypothetical protein
LNLQIELYVGLIMQPEGSGGVPLGQIARGAPPHPHITVQQHVAIKFALIITHLYNRSPDHIDMMIA